MFTKKIAVCLMTLGMAGFAGYTRSAPVDVTYSYFENSTQFNGACTDVTAVDGKGAINTGLNYTLKGNCKTQTKNQGTQDSSLTPIGKLTYNGIADGATGVFDIVEIKQNSQTASDGSVKASYNFTLQAPKATVQAPIVTAPPTAQVPIITAPLSNDCKDDFKSLLLPCASNPKIIITEPNPIGETYLPGCAGINNVAGRACFMNNPWMKDEIYALRFKFAEVKKTNVNDDSSEISIQSVTRDFYDEFRYKMFDISISEIPGDFDETRLGKACVQKGPEQGADLGIQGKQVIPGKTNRVLTSYECPLTPGKQYYINVKASQPGCRDPLTNTYPTKQGCMTIIRTGVIQP